MTFRRHFPVTVLGMAVALCGSEGMAQQTGLPQREADSAGASYFREDLLTSAPAPSLAAAMPAPDPEPAGASPSSAPQGTTSQSQKDWGFGFMPYLWVAGLNGDIAFPRLNLEVDASFRDITQNLKAAFMGAAELRYRRFVLLADGTFLRLKDDRQSSGPPAVALDLEATVAFGTVTLEYAFEPSDKFRLASLVGARWWLVDADIGITGDDLGRVNQTFSRTWADPVGGLSAKYNLTDKLFVRGIGDVGGGSSKITWQAYGGVGYELTDWFVLSVAYRLLGVDYNRDDFGFDVVTKGALIGFEFRL